MEDYWAATRAVELTERTMARAGQLASLNGLRAAAAVHLAGGPRPRVDDRDPALRGVDRVRDHHVRFGVVVVRVVLVLVVVDRGMPEETFVSVAPDGEVEPEGTGSVQLNSTSKPG